VAGYPYFRGRISACRFGHKSYVVAGSWPVGGRIKEWQGLTGWPGHTNAMTAATKLAGGFLLLREVVREAGRGGGSNILVVSHALSA
jgi:hypothetical protein